MTPSLLLKEAAVVEPLIITDDCSVASSTCWMCLSSLECQLPLCKLSSNAGENSLWCPQYRQDFFGLWQK